MVDFSLFVHFSVTISIILDFVLIYVITRNRDQLSEKFTWLAITIIVFVALWILCVEALFVVLTYTNHEIIGNAILTPIGYFFSLSAMLLIQIFVRFFVESTLRILDTAYLVGLWALMMGLMVGYLIAGINKNEDLMKEIHFATNLIYIVFILSIAIFMHQDFIRLKLEPLSSKQLKQVNYLHYGLVLGFLIQIPILYVTAVYDILLVLFASIGISGALIFIINAYLTDPRVAFVLPEKTYLLVLANKYGTPVYSRNFMDREESEETILVSGTIKAVTTIMTQFYQVETLPRLLEFEDRLILVKWNEEYFIALISDKDSSLLRAAMDRMDTEISTLFPNFSNILSENHSSEIENIVKRNFYFIWY